MATDAHLVVRHRHSLERCFYHSAAASASSSQGPATTMQQQMEVPVLSVLVQVLMQMCMAGVCQHLYFLCRNCWRGNAPPCRILSPNANLQMMQHTDAVYSIPSAGVLQRTEDKQDRLP